MVGITKTLGPIHFEDLDPHRFEDLIRNLIYDFKEWQSIEATGRSGNDGGFDIRAWEKLETTEEQNQDEENNDNAAQPTHPMEGNLWMIQCKREKELGPKRVKEIVSEISEANPLYGYILVAPATFSTDSFDVFREELRKKGVMEFYLWGKSALEDMLYLPKNDRILFAFFGFSLVTQRRSRKTEIRFGMLNKNKLVKILADGDHKSKLYKSVLIRDAYETNYPYSESYKDFDTKPRWELQRTYNFHPLGLIFSLREYFAYIDFEKKEYDFVTDIDLVVREKDHDQETAEEREKKYKKRQLIEDYWEHMPRKNQAHVMVEAIIRFDDMLVIDDKGDYAYPVPHIYCEYKYTNTPYKKKIETLLIDRQEILYLKENGYKRIKYFPDTFPEIKEGKTYSDDTFIDPGKHASIMVKNGHIKTIYAADSRHDFLNARDKIRIKGSEDTDPISNGYKKMNGIEVMHKYQIAAKDYIENSYQGVEHDIAQQIGRAVSDEEMLTILEVKNVYYWEFPSVNPEKAG